MSAIEVVYKPVFSGLRSLDPPRVWDQLDLGHPGLEQVRAAAEAGQREAALTELLGYYRRKFPLPADPLPADPRDVRQAENLVRHVMMWAPYEPLDYGP